MPRLNWDVFENLPGAAAHNFEMLCRAVIRRHYASKGHFRALNNQPGVEFDLHLTEDCAPLGRAGQWFGWQCKWFELASGQSLSTSRREQIEHSIRTTEKRFPEITHWVLWTKHALTAGDQAWFRAITTPLTLLPWSSVELDEHLSGEAALLRETYFGELVLTPDNLTRMQSLAVAPVKNRWQPEVHQVVHVEEDLRNHLAEPQAWTEITKAAEGLMEELNQVEQAMPDLPADLAAKTTAFVECVRAFLTTTHEIIQSLTRGHLETLRDALPAVEFQLPDDLKRVPRTLRSVRSPAGLLATNALASVRDLHRSFFDLYEHLCVSMVAVVGEAGMGKTELAVALTLPSADRPAGLLLHGKNLHAGGTLDDLASKVSGRRAATMELLIAALDAAAARSGCRLPLVIDALNEAEDPRDWKNQLAVLAELLKDYPHVVVVVTLRPAFTEDTVPADFKKMYLRGFVDNAWEAVGRYLQHYKIHPGDARFHTRLVEHPLTLRLYCEVTNPERKEWVQVQGTSSNLSDLFEKYFTQVAGRITELSSRHHRIHRDDVTEALVKIGLKLWESRQRSVAKAELRSLLDHPQTRWEDSMVRHLEQNGVLLTGASEMESDGQAHHVSLLYDLMAGHVIAEALVSGKSRQQFQAWFQQPSVLALLQESSQGHPYAADIIRSLTTLLPRRHAGQQLWKMAEEPLRTQVLLETVVLEARHLDQETVSALQSLLTRVPGFLGNLLPDLMETRALIHHPFNALFVSQVLESLTVTERDLHWSEALRSNTQAMLDDLAEQEKRWRSDIPLTPGDDLKAQWISWYLTSNVRTLRDLACRALHCYGQRQPQGFQRLMRRMLSVNDPYVVERLMAAALGVTLAQADHRDFVQNHLPAWGGMVYDHFFASGSLTATTHVLIMDWARRLITVALQHHPSLLTPAEIKRTQPPYPGDLRRRWGTSKDRYANQYRDGNDPFGLDFRNYTLGQLVPDRRKYDDHHPEFIQVKGRIRWRIYQLGYTLERFSRLDQTIARMDRSGRGADGLKTERYGKKYAWIAFHEIAGLRLEQKKLGDRDPSDFHDIDPSFPDPPRQCEVATIDVLQDPPMDTEAWIRRTDLPRITPWLRQPHVDGCEGPWLLLNAEATLEDAGLGRRLVAVIRMVLVQPDQVALLQELYGDDRVETSMWPQLNTQFDHAFASDLPVDLDNEMVLALIRDEGMQTIEERGFEFHREGAPISTTELGALRDAYRNALASQPGKRLSKRKKEQIFVDLLEAHHVDIQEVHTTHEERKITDFTIKVTSPVVEANWDGKRSAANPGWSVVVPNLDLVNHFSWQRTRNQFSFEDQSGQLCSLYVTHEQDGTPHNGQNFAYIRESALMQYAIDRNLEVLWVVNGERSRNTKGYDASWNDDREGHVHYTAFHGLLFPPQPPETEPPAD